MLANPMKRMRPSRPILNEIPYCLGEEDIITLSSSTVAQSSSRKTLEPTPIPKIKASSYGLLVFLTTERACDPYEEG